MCGIAGILDNNSKILPASPIKALQLMLDALEHRGPDDRGEVQIGSEKGVNLYLGHQRLSIIDPGQGDINLCPMMIRRYGYPPTVKYITIEN